MGEDLGRGVVNKTPCDGETNTPKVKNRLKGMDRTALGGSFPVETTHFPQDAGAWRRGAYGWMDG